MTDDNGFVPDNTTGTVFIRIAVPELKNQVGGLDVCQAMSVFVCVSPGISFGLLVML